MSHQLGNVVSEILKRYFGEIVEKVGCDLFSNGSKPLAMIAKTTGLPRIKVVESLRTLLKYDLASFEPAQNGILAEYKISPENVLLLIRYPRYLLQTKGKFGSIAEIIVEEMLLHGTITATKLLVSIAKKYKNDKEKNVTILALKDMFISLATAGYLQQAPVAEMKEGSEVPTLVSVATIVPDLDIRTLVLAMTDEATESSDNIYWKVNFDRFHQDFRDDILIKAMTRRIDDNAGELVHQLLTQLYLHSAPWAECGGAVSALELKDACRRLDRPLLNNYLEHYLKVLEENGSGFVRRIGDAAGGQYCLQMKHAAKELLLSIIEHVVTEKLGSKCARIFRLIKEKKYIEEEDIRKHAMLPNKECKELTYKLMEEHFISVQPMRKAATSGGPVKAIYLYYINLHETAWCVREVCVRAWRALGARAGVLRRRHARLADKQRRVRTIVHGMRLRGEPQLHIDDVEDTITPPERQLLASVEKQLKQLSVAELELDKTLFIINWYFMYK